jgi:hypothetical protein
MTSFGDLLEIDMSNISCRACLPSRANKSLKLSLLDTLFSNGHPPKSLFTRLIRNGTDCRSSWAILLKKTS